MQVSEGLKRATGRDEQFQHHLGTLIFPCRRSSFIPSSLKIKKSIVAKRVE
jgi:hypothetical protein